MKKLNIIIFLISLAGYAFAQKTLDEKLLWDFKRLGEFVYDVKSQNIYYSSRAYSIKENNSKNYILSFNLKTKESKTVLTEEYNAFGIQLNPTNNHLGFISYKSGSRQVYEINPDTKEVKQITDVADGVDLFKYAPDGLKILWASRIKLDLKVNEIYPDLDKSNARIMDGLMYRHWNQWHDYSYNHIFYADNNGQIIKSGIDILKDEKVNAPTMPFGGAEQISWSKDSKSIFYTSKKLKGTHAALSTNNDIYQYNLETSNTLNHSSEFRGYDNDPAISPNGNLLAWLSMEEPGYEADKNRLIIKDLSKGTIKNLDKITPHTINSFIWINNEKIAAIITIEATHQLVEIDLKKEKLNIISSGDHDINSVLFTGDKNYPYAILKMSINRPTGLFLMDAKGNDLQIDQENDYLVKEINWGRVEKRWITTSDHKKMLTWVVYPPNFDSTKKYPTLLYCQGGPQSPVSSFFSYRWNFQLMAAKGYIVVAPNRRGLPGFGEEWNDQIRSDYGGQAMKDYLSAIDSMSNCSFVNKDKLGAVGASFGGYSVFWLAGNHQNRFKAFISHCGMFNMESWYGTTEEMFFANSDNGPYWDEKNKENYKKSSPHQYVKNWNTPILIIHNELDYRVPLSEGMQAFTAAQLLGIPSKFLYFPDEGHWVVKPQNSILWNRVFFDWLDEYLKN